MQASRCGLMTKKHTGGDFYDFLRDEHLLDDTEALAHRTGTSWAGPRSAPRSYEPRL
jgi:hypothetical protein